MNSKGNVSNHVAYHFSLQQHRLCTKFSGTKYTWKILIMECPTYDKAKPITTDRVPGSTQLRATKFMNAWVSQISTKFTERWATWFASGTCKVTWRKLKPNLFYKLFTCEECSNLERPPFYANHQQTSHGQSVELSPL